MNRSPYGPILQRRGKYGRAKACSTWTGRDGFLLDFWFGRGQVAGDYFVLKTRTRVGAIAERLVLRGPAAAEAYHCATAEAEGLTLGIGYFKIPFDTD